MSEETVEPVEQPITQPAEGEAKPVESKAWYDTLSPEYRDNPSIKKYKSQDEFAKGFLEAQKFIGKEKLPLPGENAKPEEWAMVYDRLGRPAKPEEYKLSEVQLPEGLSIKEENLSAFKEHAHNLGLNQKQTDELWKFYSETQKQAFGEMVEQNQVQIQEAEKALRKEWGTAFSERLSLADKVLKQVAGEDYNDLRMKIGNDPKAIKMLAKLGASMSEDTLGVDNPKGFGKSPEEALSEIKRIQGEMISKKDHPLNDPFHPEHELMKKKIDDLYMQAYVDNQ
jgi:hypothetical protein